MIQIVCAVKDRAADAYGRPFFVATVGVAIRSFMDEVNRDAPDNQLFAHPDDFDLFELGTFDDSNGLIVMLPEPKLLMLGKQVRPSV
jgi:hypothetical protein